MTANDASPNEESDSKERGECSETNQIKLSNVDSIVDESSQNGNQKSDIDSARAYCSQYSKEHLNSRQWMLFCTEMERLADWMRTAGRDPSRLKGHSEYTVQNTIQRLDKIFRRIWSRHGTKILQLNPNLVDEYNRLLARDEITKQNGKPFAPASKDKQNEALQKYFEWRTVEHGGDPWTPEYTFEEKSANQPDEFSKNERRKLREISLDFKTIPRYSDLSPSQRDQWKQYISMRLGKPKKEVEPSDWEQINRSWKIPSLIWISLDTGLRPIEVERSTIDWLRLDKEALYIPKSASAKNRDHWECALLPQTVEIAKRWEKEREYRDEYHNTDTIWLTRENNPYNSSSLNYLLDRLCEEAEIDLDRRKISWYSIRHSVGDHLTSEGGLQQAKAQLRHKSITSTLRYQDPTVEERQDSLKHIG